MTEVSIELAKPNDAERLADISKRAFDSDVEVGAPGEGGPPGYDSPDHQRRMIEDSSSDYLKIMSDGKIVGGTTAYRISDTHYEIFNVFIDPDYHRKGIGRESFRLIMERYPQAKRWTLDTPEWNTRTKAYYEHLGFKQYGIFRWVPTFDLRAYELVLDPEYKIETTKIADVADNNQRYVIEGTVDSISESREVFSKKENKYHTVAEAVVTDDSGSMKLVLWNEMIRQVKQNERIRVETAYVSTFKGEMQLNVSKFGRIAILNQSRI
ncbi:MAG: GNAT family N-acetyltransferase [Candidatus Odinarchaeota archaeon]